MSHYTGEQEQQDALYNWLKEIKLKENPFQDYSARKGSNPFYFVPLGHLPLYDLITDSQTWVIFGERGNGKTALRMMIATQCRPTNSASNVLALECNWQTLDRMLRKAGSLEALSPHHWAETLIELTIPYLPEEQRRRWTSVLVSGREGAVFLAYAHEDRSHVDELAEKLKKARIAVWYDRELHRGRRWCRELEKQIQNARAMVTVLSRQSRDSEWMEREALFAIDHGVPVIPFLLEKVDLPIWAVSSQLARNAEELIRTLRATGMLGYVSGYESLYEALGELASAAGVSIIICLVDEVDEVPGLQSQSKIVRLLSCLMAPQLRATEGFAFRYLLPVSLEEAMQRTDLRLDKCRVEHLWWTPEDLKRLIRRRMIASSESQDAPYESLGQLCDPAEGFAARIDDELVLLAERRPRAAVCLADYLLRFHCREEGPPRLIRSATWEAVKEWWRENRERVLGLSAAVLPFRISGNRIFFENQEVVLSKRYHALLRCLIYAGGSVCSHEDLARAGWPGDDPAGVTPRAIDEAIRRMKHKLQEQSIDPRWIETVRGRGYRIRPAWKNADGE